MTTKTLTRNGRNGRNGKGSDGQAARRALSRARSIEVESLRVMPDKKLIEAKVNAMLVEHGFEGGASNREITRNLSVCRNFCKYSDSCEQSEIDSPWKALWGSFKKREYKRRTVIIHSGTPIMDILVVCQGMVNVYNPSARGERIIRRVTKPGETIFDIDYLAGGKRGKWGEGIHWEEAETVEDTVIAHIPKDIYGVLLKNNPDFLVRKLTQISKAMRMSARQTRWIAFDTAEQRMARSLLGHQKSGIVLVTRRDLGEMAGLTIETAVRMLKKFEDNGMLERDGRQIKLTKKFMESQVVSSINKS